VKAATIVNITRKTSVISATDHLKIKLKENALIVKRSVRNAK